MAFLSIYYLLYADKVTISTFLSAAKASAPASPCNIFADVQSGSERFIAKLDIDWRKDVCITKANAIKYIYRRTEHSMFG